MSGRLRRCGEYDVSESSVVRKDYVCSEEYRDNFDRIFGHGEYSDGDGDGDKRIKS